MRVMLNRFTLAPLLLAATLLAGCPSNPIREAETAEQKVGAALYEFTEFQKLARTVGGDAEVPSKVRKAFLDLAIEAKPGADALDAGLRRYQAAAAALSEGATDGERVLVMTRELNALLYDFEPYLKRIRSTRKEAQP